MRSAVFLSLLFILALSVESERQSNDRYAEFKKKHILPADFQTDNETVWVNYLVNNSLCGRTETQSFIKDTEENIKQICNGASEKTNDNYDRSTKLFHVYMIESKNNTTDALEWECIIEKCSQVNTSITVKCENNLPHKILKREETHLNNRSNEEVNRHYFVIMLMTTVVFLMFLFMLSHGLNNISFSNNELVMFSDIFSNWAHPCQRSRNNNAYNQFKRRHIISREFNTSQESAWADYLTRRNLCGRTHLQSFLHKNNTNSIKRICNGRGVRDTQNLCISKRMFRVYIVKSTKRNGQCEVQLQTEYFYVIVACEVIGNRCLPVHYETQTNTEPYRHVQLASQTLSDLQLRLNQCLSFTQTQEQQKHKIFNHH
ncbi:Angiogenin [Labeo rohita]|uniref:Angiogenin n=1 Tax=Labeo rohita TaxID=84645 RepID=A0ABQ8MKI0_LABRO|nr:Angiogenin [Labeo rohita]